MQQLPEAERPPLILVVDRPDPSTFELSWHDVVLDLLGDPPERPDAA